MVIAQALICDEQQRFSLEDVSLVAPGPQELVVRNLYSGVSIGTEFALIRNKISWGPYPLCTGYQSVGVVEWVGKEVDGFHVGAKVYCRDNKSFQLLDGQAVSPVAGTHCSHLLVNPRTSHGIALLPTGVPDDVASLFVMPSVGLAGVDMANPRMGSLVLVYGVGLVGLGVVAACAHRGCRVVAVDVVERRLDLARQLGADHCINASTQDAARVVQALAPEGADMVFESTGNPECVNQAMQFCRSYGSFVMQGNYGVQPISFDFMSAHARTLTMYFPMDDGMAPCRRAVLKNMARGALPWNLTITHHITAEEAPDLYMRINAGTAGDVLGAVIRWSA